MTIGIRAYTIWRMEYAVQNQLLQIIASWYGVIAFLGLVFIVMCRKALSDLVRKISISFRKGDVEVSSEQSKQDESKDVIKTDEYAKVQKVLQKLEVEKIEELEQLVNSALETIDEQNKELEDADVAFGALLELKETYEFAYLNLYLVERTKQALLKLYNLGSSTKELFLGSLVFDELVTDVVLEREAVCSALLSHELVEVGTNGLYCASEKGERFLRFVDLV